MKKLICIAFALLIFSCSTEPVLAGPTVEQESLTAPLELPLWPKAKLLAQDDIEYSSFGLRSTQRLMEYKIIAETNLEIGNELYFLAGQQEQIIHTYGRREEQYKTAVTALDKSLKRERFWRTAERVGYILLTILIVK